jgi:hypothetical protein
LQGEDGNGVITPYRDQSCEGDSKTIWLTYGVRSVSQRAHPASFTAMSIKLMSRVWDDTRFKGTELLVLLCLADHANDEGLCWPSYTTLAKRARCSRRHVIRCALTLEAEGYLWIERVRVGEKMSKSNRFHLRFPSDAMSPVTPGSPPSDICDIFDDADVTPLVTPMSPKPSGNRKESSKEPVPTSRRACLKSSKACPSQEEADEHVLEFTGLDGAHAMMCSEKWYRAFGDADLENWKAHLGAFADKYESDYRQ